MSSILTSNVLASHTRACVRAAVKALLEVVQSGSKSIELAVMAKGESLKFLSAEEVDALLKEIEEDREKEAEKKKNDKSGSA